MALAISRVALAMGLTALLLTLAAPRFGRGRNTSRRWTVMSVATLALGLAIFALFYGLVLACDRL